MIANTTEMSRFKRINVTLYKIVFLVMRNAWSEENKNLKFSQPTQGLSLRLARNPSAEI